MWLRVSFAIVLLFLPTAVIAQTEKRIALLIGNKDYKSGVSALTNPLNDIRLVGDALRSVGFEVLKPVENAQRSAMLIAIHAFAGKLKAAGSEAVGFLYYSGHGIASAGENYLIPTDVDEPSTVLLSVQGVKQSEVLAILRGEAPNATHYLVLDACRHTLQGVRGGKGFVPVGQQSGILVAFAAEPGKTASDIGQGSGPYAAALAAELVKPAQNDLLMFHNVRVAVMDKTNGDQVPWTEDGIQRRQRVLFGGDSKARPALEVSEASREWARVDKTSVVELETFVRRHGSSPEADYARARIESLNKQVASSAAITKRVAPMGAMLRCDEYSERSICEFNPSCSWAEDKKQCQRKSGSLAAAMLEAPHKAVSPTPCLGVETQIGNEARCLKPGDSFMDCPECPEMVVVPAGSFMMGSPANEEGRLTTEGPQRKVTIGKPFATGKFEVTFADWESCKAAGGCKHKPSDEGWGKGTRPVINVSWYDAKEYISWLARKTGRTYRLLTEAEWEYAARAGSTTPFATGRTISSNQANFDGRSTRGIYRQQTVDAGSLPPNSFGLYEMHGNVWEWVEDCYRDSYPGTPSDASAWTTGDCGARVQRGGAWGSFPSGLRAATRVKDSPASRSSAVGFRLARSLNP